MSDAERKKNDKYSLLVDDQATPNSVPPGCFGVSVRLRTGRDSAVHRRWHQIESRGEEGMRGGIVEKKTTALSLSHHYTADGSSDTQTQQTAWCASPASSNNGVSGDIGGPPEGSVEREARGARGKAHSNPAVPRRYAFKAEARPDPYRTTAMAAARPHYPDAFTVYLQPCHTG